MFKLDLEKAEKPEIKLPTTVGSSKKQESSRKTSISAFLTMPKPKFIVDLNKLWKILQEMGIPVQNTKIPDQKADLPFEKSVCRSRGNS